MFIMFKIVYIDRHKKYKAQNRIYVDKINWGKGWVPEENFRLLRITKLLQGINKFHWVQLGFPLSLVWNQTKEQHNTAAIKKIHLRKVLCPFIRRLNSYPFLAIIVITFPSCFHKVLIRLFSIVAFESCFVFSVLSNNDSVSFNFRLA